MDDVMIREARLKRNLFQFIVIYNLAIIIENNGIINPLCLTPLFKVDNSFHYCYSSIKYTCHDLCV